MIIYNMINKKKYIYIYIKKKKKKIDDFELIKTIGHGAFGIVKVIISITIKLIIKLNNFNKRNNIIILLYIYIYIYQK